MTDDRLSPSSHVNAQGTNRGEPESTFELIERARKGDQDALERLFARHLRPLQRWASGRLPKWARDLADTDDLVQDTLLQTFKRIEDFEPRRVGALQAYLRQAVLNRLRDELRRKGAAPDRPIWTDIELDAGRYRRSRRRSGARPSSATSRRSQRLKPGGARGDHRAASRWATATRSWRRRWASRRPTRRARRRSARCVRLAEEMKRGTRVTNSLDDLAGAILDGTPIDWAAAESSADEADRALLDQLQTAGGRRRRSPRRPAPPPSEPIAVAAQATRSGAISACSSASGAARSARCIAPGIRGSIARSRSSCCPQTRGGDRCRRHRDHRRRPAARARPPSQRRHHLRRRADRRPQSASGWSSSGAARSSKRSRQGKTFSAAEAVDDRRRALSRRRGRARAGLLHRDIKAQNVMLADDGRVVLMDFGTGRELGDSPRPPTRGHAALSGARAAARQAIRPSAATSTASACCSIISSPDRTRCGRNSLARSPPRARARRTHGRPQLVRPDASPRLARVIERAIDPQPERRYETAEALAADLSALSPRPRLVPLAYAAAAAGRVIVAGLDRSGDIGAALRNPEHVQAA